MLIPTATALGNPTWWLGTCELVSEAARGRDLLGGDEAPERRVTELSLDRRGVSSVAVASSGVLPWPSSAASPSLAGCSRAIADCGVGRARG